MAKFRHRMSSVRPYRGGSIALKAFSIAKKKKTSSDKYSKQKLLTRMRGGEGVLQRGQSGLGGSGVQSWGAMVTEHAPAAPGTYLKNNYSNNIQRQHSICYINGELILIKLTVLSDIIARRACHIYIYRVLCGTRSRIGDS